MKQTKTFGKAKKKHQKSNSKSRRNSLSFVLIVSGGWKARSLCSSENAAGTLLYQIISVSDEMK